MTDKLKQTIQEELTKLPKDVQEVINAFDWVKVAEEIGKKNLLSEDEINNFQVETLLVLVGLEDENDYAQNIEDEVGTSKEESEKMASEAFEKIFTPINGLLENNIKRSEKSKNPDLVKTFDFILSGGDYSAFLERQNTGESSARTTERGETVLPEFSIK